MKEISGIKMYDSNEICEMLGISKPTLYKLRSKGLIRSTCMGRGKYTSDVCLKEYLNAKTAPKKKAKK